MNTQFKPVVAHILLICSLLMSIFGASAQQIEFDHKKWDFGKIQESDGEVSHSFEFINPSKSPVVIIAINTTCGCTTPDYSSKPVAPGARSSFNVTYNPFNRPGRFDRQIMVYTSSAGAPVTLTIEGDVIPRVRTMEEIYPFDMGGGFRISANYFALSRIEHDEQRQGVISYINNSKRAVKLELRPRIASGYLSIDVPERVAAQQKGVIEFSYEIPSAKPYYGTLKDILDLYVDGVKSKYSISMNGYVTEVFEEFPSERAPIAYIDSKIIKFGELSIEGEPKQMSVDVENFGEDDLILRRIETEGEVMVAAKDGVAIKRGNSFSLDIIVDPAQFEIGLFSRYITIISNDPERPMQKLRVTGIITE